MKLIYLFIVLVSLLACSSGKHTANNPQQQLEGRWVLTLFTPGDKQFAEIFGQRQPELQFQTSDNKVSGSTGCNRFSGSYAAEGTAFRFSPNMALTKMACPNYDENNFLSTMNAVNRYHIRNGQLDLLQDSTLLMTFSRAK